MDRENIKKIIPSQILGYYRKFRRWERFHNRYKYNNGLPFTKDISILNTNFKIIINPYKNCCVDDFIAKDGYWELKLSENIKKFLPRNGVFVDAGANIGYHSLFAASLHNRTTKVYAFEPQKEIHDLFVESVNRNEFTNLTIFKLGLSNSFGFAKLNIFEENKGASSLVNGLTHHTGPSQSQEIELKTLDFFKDSFDRMDVIKIDVEGFELEVILGSEYLIQKYRPVLLVEFSPGLYNFRDPKITEQLISKLESLKYKTQTLDGKEIDLRKWIGLSNLDTHQIDIVCLP
jgi:FkbM family methyltransferase